MFFEVTTVCKEQYDCSIILLCGVFSE